VRVVSQKVVASKRDRWSMTPVHTPVLRNQPQQEEQVNSSDTAGISTGPRRERATRPGASSAVVTAVSGGRRLDCRVLGGAVGCHTVAVQGSPGRLGGERHDGRTLTGGVRRWKNIG